MRKLKYTISENIILFLWIFVVHFGFVFALNEYNQKKNDIESENS